MEVIFGGIKASPEALVKSAVEEDADILGISSLSGAHLAVAKELLRKKQEMGADTLKIVMGGIIPICDVVILSSMGIDLVIPTGNVTLSDAVEQVGTLVTARLRPEAVSL